MTAVPHSHAQLQRRGVHSAAKAACDTPPSASLHLRVSCYQIGTDSFSEEGDAFWEKNNGLPEEDQRQPKKRFLALDDEVDGAAVVDNIEVALRVFSK